MISEIHVVAPSGVVFFGRNSAYGHEREKDFLHLLNMYKFAGVSNSTFSGLIGNLHKGRRVLKKALH